MASITDLATILAEQDDYYAKTDPFLLGAQGLYSGAKGMGEYNLKPWEKLLAGALTGLGGGLMQGIGTARVQQKQTALADSLSTLLEDPSRKDEVLAANPDAAKFMPSIQIAQKQRQQEAAAQLASALANKGLGIDQTGTIKNIAGYGEALAEQEGAKERAKLSATNNTFQNGPLAKLSGIPQNLQKEVIDQEQQRAGNIQNINFADQQFEKAKQINSLSAVIPGSTASNEMTGVKIALTTSLQAKLGREMNAREQEQLAAATPDWNDTIPQIELKKMRFKELMASTGKQTPLIDALDSYSSAAGTSSGSTAGAGSPVTIQPPAGAVLTNRRSKDGKPAYLLPDGKYWTE